MADSERVPRPYVLPEDETIPPEELPFAGLLEDAISKLSGGDPADLAPEGLARFRRWGQRLSLLVNPEGAITKIVIEVDRQGLLRGNGAILGRSALTELIASGQLQVDPTPTKIDAVSFDVHLGPKLKKITGVIDLREELRPEHMEEIDLNEAGHYDLSPGEHVLGSTLEWIAVPPGYYGEIWARGRFARAGISAHNSDPQIDPGFKGCITKEIVNNHSDIIRIRAGDRLARISIWRILGPEEEQGYDGGFSGQAGPTVFSPDQSE